MTRTNNATIEVIIEDGGFNNSLAGALNCPNEFLKSTGGEASKAWIKNYLKDGRNQLPITLNEKGPILGSLSYSNFTIPVHDRRL